MKLGIGTYTYMWSIGFPGAEPERPMRAMDLLCKARELGVRVVQFGPNLPLYRLSPGEIEELLAASREMGLELEIGTRGLDTEHLCRMIDFAVRCGATLLRTVPESPAAGELTPRLVSIHPRLRSAGVRLAIENSLIPAGILRSALEDVNTEFIGITLDTVNSLAIPEGTEQVATTLARWTYCLHIKDFSVTREWHMMGFRIEGRPAGKGSLNVPWLLEQIGATGVRCNAIVELWPPPQPALKDTIALERCWAEESVSYLRTLIKE